ncbi:MAG: ATPase, T2SS/T4P/T4SS family [Fibrobacterota bacterium]
MKRRPLKKVGEILIEKGLITLEQLTRGLAEQKKHGTSLGSSLVRLGFIEYKKLETVLSEELERVQSRKIGEILLEQHVISEAQLADTLKRQKEEGKLLGELLVQLGYVSSQQLFDALSTQFDVKTMDIEGFLFKKEVLALLPYEALKALKCIPLRVVGGRLVTAMNEPFNQTHLNKIEALTKMPVEPVFIREEALQRAFAQEYPARGRDSALSVEGPSRQSEAAVRLAHLVLSQAIGEGASYVHFDPTPEGLSVRFRIDGVLQPQSPIPPVLSQGVLDFLKGLARLNAEARRVIQSGFFAYKFENAETHFRLSTFPVLTGYDTYREKASLKALNREGGLEKLEDLGFYTTALEKFQELLASKSGVLLVSGPVDSGVTTTLYCALRRIQRDSLHVATIEKFIDAFLPGVSQTQIDMVKGYTFKEGLRSVLMDDADVIMVSDLDEGGSGHALFQAALNGRLILTSMHAHDAASAYTVLRDMGLEPVAYAHALRGVLNQRLVRRVCPQCREAYHAAPELLESLRLRPQTMFFRGRGCQVCNFSGFRGRIALFELLVPDETLRTSIATGLTAVDIRRTAVNAGMMTLRMDGMKKVLEGITTVEQVLGITGRE